MANNAGNSQGSSAGRAIEQHQAEHVTHGGTQLPSDNTS